MQIIYIFTCGSFVNTVRISHYIALKGIIIIMNFQHCVGISLSYFELCVRFLENQENIRVIGIQFEIRTGHFSNAGTSVTV